jgi:hypothetical protein
MTLLEHIKNINIKSKAWMAANPGSWAGMVVEDIKFWNDQGIFTVEDYERSNLETSVYEMHKEAYGVKGRHYNFSKMSTKDLEKELDHLCDVAKREAEIEKRQEEDNLKAFESRIDEALSLGAENREDAIKWILQAEGLDKEHDKGYICYTLGLGYDKEHLFQTKH